MSAKVNLGLTISNRGPLIFPDEISPSTLIELAEMGEDLGYHSLWVGDSILAKPRYDSISVLSAIASRTDKVKLGVACMASFVLRNPLLLAYQWATLDQLSNGRTILAACMGGGSREAGGDFEDEFKNLAVDYKSRARILEENVRIIKRLWTEDEVSYAGKFCNFVNVKLLPKPAQKPHPPIYIVSNPHHFKASKETIERALRRTAELGDGWMTTLVTPDNFRHGSEFIKKELERSRSKSFERMLYYNININDDRELALRESKEFLDKYYMTNYSRQTLEMWVASGKRSECIKRIEEFIEAGATTISLRPTTFRQKEMVQKIAKEILPNF